MVDILININYTLSTMKKAIAASNQNFESLPFRSPQYLSWHRLFKREFTKFLESKGATKFEISKSNHFDMDGFFTLGTSIWFFMINDLRTGDSKAPPMLIRSAAHYKDFAGGRNQYISMKDESSFVEYFDRIVSRPIQRAPSSNLIAEINAAQSEYMVTGGIINTSVNAALELKY